MAFVQRTFGFLWLAGLAQLGAAVIAIVAAFLLHLGRRILALYRT
jgi:hypothetical protein